jgi:hypothetical protein
LVETAVDDDRTLPAIDGVPFARLILMNVAT